MRFTKQNKFLGLLVFIIGMMIINPILKVEFGNISLHIFFSLILAFTFSTVLEKKKYWMMALYLFIPALFFDWINYFIPNFILDMIGYGFALVFIGYILYLLSPEVFKPKDLGFDHILGSVSIYFLIGMFWAIIFMVLQTVNEYSFVGLNQVDLEELLYYVYVTQTTLGYGDIYPVSATARTMSVLAAISGQFYMAIMVAGLVGMFLQKKIKSL